MRRAAWRLIIPPRDAWPAITNRTVAPQFPMGGRLEAGVVCGGSEVHMFGVRIRLSIVFVFLPLLTAAVLAGQAPAGQRGGTPGGGTPGGGAQGRGGAPGGGGQDMSNVQIKT